MNDKRLFKEAKLLINQDYLRIEKFARELHEHTTSLSLLKLIINKPLKNQRLPKDFKDRLIAINDCLDESIAELNKITNMAFPRKLRILGIEKCVEGLLLSMKKETGILYESGNYKVAPKSFDPPIEVVYYQIIEDILNFIKQVGHTKITLSTRIRNNKLITTIIAVPNPKKEAGKRNFSSERALIRARLSVYGFGVLKSTNWISRFEFTCPVAIFKKTQKRNQPGGL